MKKSKTVKVTAKAIRIGRDDRSVIITIGQIDLTKDQAINLAKELAYYASTLPTPLPRNLRP